MKTLGVITTTYNRGYCIHQVYESLKKQDCKDFMWLVIDDGSTDNTQEIIQSFINEGYLDIKYIYQENKGMTGARNTAYENIKTEINTIIDSDDWLEEGAVKKIIDFWKTNKKENIAGIIALNTDLNGNLIGNALPSKVKECTLTELRDKYKVKGDKKLIYRSDISRKYPYPVFEGEKFFPASYKFRMIDLDYKMLLMDEVICVVDCNENSMTFDKINQYRSCPKGFAFFRNQMINISSNPSYNIKQSIHYIAESLLAGNLNFLQTSSKKLYTILCLPVGIPLYFYLKHTKRKMIKV